LSEKVALTAQIFIFIEVVH